MRLRGSGPAAALFAALVAGCGSSTLSTRDLRTAASTICRSASTSLARVGDPASPAQAGRFLQRGVLILTPELAQLRTLHASGRAGQELDAAVQAFERKLTQVQDAERALGGGEDPLIAFRTLQQQIAPTVAEENRHWQALGIPDCLSS